jgi:hypothetical protein
VNEFLASIFGKKTKPMHFVEFWYFNELVPESWIYKEFNRVVETPLEELGKQQNRAWTEVVT